MEHPIRFEADAAHVRAAGLRGCGLSEVLITALERHGIDALFPVQAAVVPEVIAGARQPCHPGDVCVSAPTGSGKTLAYALPIIQCLHKRVVPRVRAMIVVPSRDLVQQVKRVFDTYCHATAAAIAAKHADPADKAQAFARSTLKVAAFGGHASFQKEQAQLGGGAGGGTIADIVVATPGRLVEHINGTVGFELKHLQFLVVDEADRLLGQSYNRWLPTLLKAAQQGDAVDASGRRRLAERRGGDVGDAALQTPQRYGGASLAIRASQHGGHMRKLLFSATLSHDPEQLSALHLILPRLYLASSGSGGSDDNPDGEGAAGGGGGGAAAAAAATPVKTGSEYAMPSTLREHMVVCHATRKPMVLLHLLVTCRHRRLIVFAGSIEATHRLYLLMHLFGGIAVEEFSSSLHAKKRREIIERFRTGKLHALVCSDAMARGIDLEGVEHVVNYDPPTHPRTYVHRSGRTARAGASGSVYTLCRRQEVHHFRALRKKIDSKKAPEMKLDDDDYATFDSRYEAALEALAERVENETKATGDKGVAKAALSRALKSQQLRRRPLLSAERSGASNIIDLGNPVSVAGDSD